MICPYCGKHGFERRGDRYECRDCGPTLRKIRARILREYYGVNGVSFDDFREAAEYALTLLIDSIRRDPKPIDGVDVVRFYEYRRVRYFINGKRMKTPGPIETKVMDKQRIQMPYRTASLHRRTYFHLYPDGPPMWSGIGEDNIEWKNRD